MLQRIWKIFRAAASCVLLLAVLAPAALYLLLSAPAVQNGVRDIACRELSELLGVPVEVERVTISPFNRVAVKGVSVTDESGDTILSVREISAGVELMRTLRLRRIMIDYALLDGATVAVKRPAPGEPSNIDPIIARLRSDKPRDKEGAFDLQISTVVVHDGQLSYDVLSLPEPEDGRFNAGHILVFDLSLNAYIPRLSNELYAVDLDHLSFVERSGFRLDKLECKARFGKKGARVSGLSVNLPGTRIAFEPLELPFDGFENLLASLKDNAVNVATKGTCTVSPGDFAPFVPLLGRVDVPLRFGLDADVSASMLDLHRLSLSEPESNAVSIAMSASAEGFDKGRDSISYNLHNLTALLSGPAIANVSGGILPPKAADICREIAVTGLNVKASGTPSAGHVELKADGTAGLIAFSGDYSGSGAIEGTLDLDGLDVGLLSSNPQLGLVSAGVKGKFAMRYGRPDATVHADVSRLDFKGNTYSGISLRANMDGKDYLEAWLDVDDALARISLEAEYDARAYMNYLNLAATFSDVDLYAMGFDKSHENYLLAGSVEASLEGRDIDSTGGYVSVKNLSWLNGDGTGLRLERFDVEAHPDALKPHIDIESDFLNGSVEGQYSFTGLVPEMKAIVARTFPSLLPGYEIADEPEETEESPSYANNFNFDLTLSRTESVADFFHLPVQAIYPASITGTVNTVDGTVSVLVDAPYLQQGDKIITNTNVFARADRELGSCHAYLTSEVPTKKGLMALACGLDGADDRIDTRLDWTIERAIPLNGTIDLAAILGRDEDGALATRVEFHPGAINFGDDVWQILPSAIDYSKKEIAVEGFRLSAGRQNISIDGRVGPLESDSLSISLENISLLPIFETLEIDKALIGGRATGVFEARQVLSPEPFLLCERLHVDSIGYNRCTLGDADIVASWNNERKSFYLDADITEPGGLKSRIYGDIFPMGEALDINFDANHVKVGFLRPFMEAFASDIDGFATGHARLFGTFKEIDMTGDIFADNVKLKIDFTNTWYTATDTIHLDPGRIVIDNVTVRDVNGHTARLDGLVEHTFFKEPVFTFNISDARDFLSFNGTPKQNPDWYGTIYGNGRASIKGRPGVVDINVDMSTAAGSTFTFVLSDRLDADDYTFISFRDVTPPSPRDSITDLDDTPEAVREYQARMNTLNTDAPSAYNMDIHVDITPQARMTLVMDPVGGDEIKASGSGSLRLVYKSLDNELNMWGSYTLDHGNYNFTLQDIIIKDFTIKEGSTINFNGDPYGAEAKIDAFYSLNANLSDLDESFLQDKELNRTNVPVHALMQVSGDIRQPEIHFDLEFPTLTQDTYRKVKSIVSTEDMMNRQIIYLLALNRFYTPDYMASTTKGNELFSVASSTISSQLGSMLGKLSENWSIAPNLRSDRGDFSDVEVDVALSSRLLNNRLLFNGNLGYRDKSLNSNQFIGDFDIEYLLNKRGSWRLKAYNRYNDRNFYVRTAQTTQGVGIMFKRDFDSFFSFLGRRKKKTVEEPDSTTVNVPAPSDSIPSQQ